jgi:flagellar protein FlgJ
MAIAPGDLPTAALKADALAADSRSLEALRRQAGRDPQQAIRSAARQFEAMFLQMVLKSMREATPKSGLFDSSAGDLYAGMLDQQLAGVGAGRAGLAEIIERQLTRHMRPGVGDGKTPAAARAVEAVRGQPRGAIDAVRAYGVAMQAAAATPPKATAAGPVRAPTGVGDATPQSTFVSRMWDHALVAARETGVPAKFIIGQAALESGWGQREITGADGARSFNLFGIKATGGWTGRTVEAVTTEYENGAAVRKVEKFRAYNNYTEAFRDWARLMAANPRYAGAVGQTGAAEFAHGLQRAGYATDPNYGAKLQRVIETAQALRRVG